MHFTKSFFLAIIALLLIVGHRAQSQANVTENQSASILVDAATGSDAEAESLMNGAMQPGAVPPPLKTIQAAVNVAVANRRKSIGTKVMVNPGVYRESVNITSSSGSASAPITIEAAQAGTTVISGSDVLTGWNQESSNPPIYSHSWTNGASSCPTPGGWPTNFDPIARRTEMVFVNSVPLTQVTNYSQLSPGSFFVDDGANLLYVAPAADTNMSAATVEVATRRNVLNVSGQNNVVLRGLVLTHAANCINTSGATINSSSNVLVDQVEAIFNNWGGLGVFSSNNITVQNSIASYNGGVGFQANEDTNAVFSSNESDYNNWRGAQAAFYDWGMGGTKLLGMRNTTVQNHSSYRNQAQGLWFDTDNENITVNNATLAGNTLAGLQIERNPGPVMFEKSRVCSNGIGVNVLTSEKLTISNNVFYNNSGTNVRQAELYVAGTPGGQTISDWQTGQHLDLFTTDMSVWNNTFEDASTGQTLFGTYLSGGDWSRLADSLNAGGNSWYDPYNASAFTIMGNRMLNLSGWQSAVGTDYSSWWGQPSTSPQDACNAPPPMFADFNVDLDNRTYTMSGGQATATARINSFGYGSVALSVTGLPSGVSANLSQQNLVDGVVTVGLSAANRASNQTVPVTLWARGADKVHSVTFELHVIP